MDKKNATLQTRKLDDKLFSSFLSGDLNSLLFEIKRDAELCLCFRGEYANVYYKGDSLFKIQQLNKLCKLNFDFNHARYTKEHQKFVKMFRGLGYTYSESDGDPRRRILTCKYPQDNKAGNQFWEKSIAGLKALINDFLDVEKKYDWFKQCYKNNKSCHLERQRQQEIMRENNTLGAGYFIYDMEYDQPRNSSKEEKSGRFDMLALRRVNSCCYNLVLIELKSAPQACRGNCGIEKHYRDLSRYLRNEIIMEMRKKDAIEICRQYALLGLAKHEDIKIEGIEILFVFTDEATSYAQQIKNSFERCILSSSNLRLKFNDGVL